jgi:hypothetical protein
MPWTSSYLHRLELHLGVKLTTMQTCYELSEKTLKELSNTVGEKLPADEKFLGVLKSKKKREELKELTFEEAPQHTVFIEVRKLGHEFQEALERLFLTRGTNLGDLTLRYGVF